MIIFIYPIVSWLTSISLIHIYWQHPHIRSHHVPHDQHPMDSWRPRVHNHVSMLSDKAANKPSTVFTITEKAPTSFIVASREKNRFV